MKKIVFKIIQSILLIAVIFISTSNDLTEEYKVNNNNLNKSINLSTMAMKVTEFDSTDLYSAKETYTGDLTAYVYNCPACNGHLGCMYTYNVMDGTNTYNDSVYGEVSIVASSSNLPCGSIIRFSSTRLSSEPVFAIVLDRGVLGTDIDFLAKSNESANQIGRSSITYDVLRNGWQNAS